MSNDDLQRDYLHRNHVPFVISIQQVIGKSGNHLSDRPSISEELVPGLLYRIKVTYNNAVYHDFTVVLYFNDNNEVSFFLKDIFDGVMAVGYVQQLLKKLKSMGYSRATNHVLTRDELLNAIRIAIPNSKSIPVGRYRYTKASLAQWIVDLLYEYIEEEFKLTQPTKESEVMSISEEIGAEILEKDIQHINKITERHQSSVPELIRQIEEIEEINDRFKDYVKEQASQIPEENGDSIESSPLENLVDTKVIFNCYEDFDSVDAHCELSKGGFLGKFEISLAKDEDGHINFGTVSEYRQLIRKLESVVELLRQMHED